MIGYIGGHAFSSVGGIQNLNRQILSCLHESGRLSAAFFRFDTCESIKQGTDQLYKPGSVSGFAGNRRAFVSAALRHSKSSKPERWICDHLNYAPVGWLATAARAGRLMVITYAYELVLPIKAVRKWALRRAGLVLCISDFTRRLCRRLGVSDERIRVCYPGRDTGVYRAWQEREARRSEKILLIVGRMTAGERSKGHFELLRAAARLHLRHPELRVVMAGSGDNINELRKYTTELGIANVVRFPGYVPDEELHELYRQAYVFVMPSQYEGFGLAYVEAMSQGVPCIASLNDAGCEVVNDGETGFCVPYGDDVLLESAIERLLRDPDLRDRMGRAAAGRHSAYFTSAAFNRRFHSIIDAWEGGSSETDRSGFDL